MLGYYAAWTYKDITMASIHRLSRDTTNKKHSQLYGNEITYKLLRYIHNIASAFRKAGHVRFKQYFLKVSKLSQKTNNDLTKLKRNSDD